MLRGKIHHRPVASGALAGLGIKTPPGQAFPACAISPRMAAVAISSEWIVAR